MKNSFLSRFLRPAPLALALISMTCFTAVAQESKAALPRVVGAAIPLYPPLARAANVQGVVHVKVTTDGQRAIATHAEDGPNF